MSFEDVKVALIAVWIVLYAGLLIYAVVMMARDKSLFSHDEFEEPEEEAVSHPNHYNRDGLPECQELIEKLLSGYSEFLTESELFELGNVIKYIYRAPLKNKGEDLKKAAFYMKMLTKS